MAMRMGRVLSVGMLAVGLLAELWGCGVAAAAVPPTQWSDLGITFAAPSGDAYYPSALHDTGGFGAGSPLYKMWYSNGSGAVFVISSADGQSWSAPTAVTGLGNDAHHVQVVYEANCFGAVPCDASAARYRIWYWDINAQLYSICAMATAESIDGVVWTNDTTLAQMGTSVVTGDCAGGGGVGWNRGTYGPVDVIYQPGAPSTGTDPWNYSYVMYYDGTDGSSEVTGLAYSADGMTWTGYSPLPVLDKGSGSAWDCDDAAYGTVYRSGGTYHFWYSGGGGDNGAGACAAGAPIHQGIGYASSADGTSWTKSAGNPIFHIGDGFTYRNQRVYTPAVVDDGSGILKMYYSAVGSDGRKKIGLAINAVSCTSDTDCNDGLACNGAETCNLGSHVCQAGTAPSCSVGNLADPQCYTAQCIEPTGCVVQLSDADGDGVCDVDDNCLAVANPGQDDSDGDGIGDVCDNCPISFNPAQSDADGNGAGDLCDSTNPPAPLTLKKVKLRSNVSPVPGLDNGTVTIRGVFDATEFGDALGEALSAGVTVGVSGAGLGAPEVMVFLAPRCVQGGARRFKCIGTRGEVLSFQQQRKGKLFNLRLSAGHRPFAPRLSDEAVEVVIAIGGVDRRDQIPACAFLEYQGVANCRK